MCNMAVMLYHALVLSRGVRSSPQHGRCITFSFWDEGCNNCFDGGNILIPAVNSYTYISIFPVLGTILSHGFLVSNFLPLCIVFPTLVAVLLGPTVLIPDSILVDTFADHLSTYESAFIHDMLVYVPDKNQLPLTVSSPKC